MTKLALASGLVLATMIGSSTSSLACDKTKAEKAAWAKEQADWAAEMAAKDKAMKAWWASWMSKC